MTINIVPNDDKLVHEHYAGCKCNPKYELEDGVLTLTHNSFDLRELFEKAAENLN